MTFLSSAIGTYFLLYVYWDPISRIIFLIIIQGASEKCMSIALRVC